MHADEIALGETERQRDEALERVAALETLTGQLRRETETLKTAGSMSDQRVRGLERDIERMRAAAHAPSCACSTCTSLAESVNR
jgi:hypothetical protein